MFDFTALADRQDEVANVHSQHKEMLKLFDFERSGIGENAEWIAINGSVMGGCSRGGPMFSGGLLIS